MQKNEFKQSNNDFDEMLRRARERIQKDQEKKREKRWQKFADDDYLK